jgi:hypothetical protein
VHEDEAGVDGSVFGGYILWGRDEDVDGYFLASADGDEGGWECRGGVKGVQCVYDVGGEVGYLSHKASCFVGESVCFALAGTVPDCDVGGNGLCCETEVQLRRGDEGA